MACIQAQALAKEIRKYFLRLKFQLILMAFCFVAVTFYGSYQQQHKDIIYMRESISKFYKDFDSSVFTNASTIKEFLDQMSKFSVPFVNLDEIRKSADKVGHQIEILQSYEHDKTGRVDLALENSGGRIAKIGANTEMFYSCNLFWKLIGCPNKINGPEKLIQPQMHYGECFRFKGKEGSVTIRLVRGALLDAVTVEHLSKKMSPTGEVSAAPRKFSVSVSLLVVVRLRSSHHSFLDFFSGT